MRANLRFPLYASALFAFAMRRVPHPWRGLIGRKMGNEPSSQPARAPVPVLFLCSFVKEGGEAGDPSPEINLQTLQKTSTPKTHIQQTALSTQSTTTCPQKNHSC